MNYQIRSGEVPSVTKRISSVALRPVIAAIVCLLFFLVIASQSLGVTATRHIKSTGGDCASIGVWDQATKTCTLTGDLTFGSTNGIVIDANGVTLDGAGHTITGVVGYTSGVTLYGRSNVTIKNLTISQFYYGIYLTMTTSSTVTGNTINGNTYGVYLQNASGNRIFNNNFESNTNHGRVSGGSGNVFSLPAPVGGNWWNGYDSPAEGCNDFNTDYFCDAPYSVTGGQDDLPWNMANAWSVPPAPDTDPPAITSIQPAGSIGVGTTTIAISYTDRSNINMASAAVTLDGNPVSGCTATETGITCPPVTGYATGPHEIGGFIADILGNTATIGGGFSYIDDIPPVITGVSPAGFVNTTAPVISAAYSDSGTGVDLASVAVTLDGNPLSGCAVTAAGVSCAVSGLAEGSHSGTVSVTDHSSNTAAAAVVFSIDTVPPQVVDVRPTGAISTGSTTLHAGYSDAGSGIKSSSVAVYLDGTRLTGCSVSVTGINCSLKNLTQGTHTISGSVADLAGNISAISGQFTFSDTVAPVIKDLKPPIFVNKPNTIVGASFSDSGVGVDAASVAAYLDGVALSACTVTSANASCAAYGYSLGAHSFSVRVADKAGNLATASGSFTYDPASATVSKTIYLGNSATGGGCSQVGYWVASSKTCVLKEDLMFIGTNGIVVNGNGITLDGGGHFIVGTGGYTTGVSGYGRSNIAIRNLTIKQFKYGAYMALTNNSLFHNNSFTGNTYGIYLASANGTTVYNNNFLENSFQAFDYNGTGNQFNQLAPDGGNYWSGYDTPAEGCNDTGGDGFCDAAYSVYGATDNLPWTTKSGWPAPPGYDGQAPSITDVQPTGVIKTGAATISAYYSDAGTGVDQASVAVYLDSSVLGGCTITAGSASCSVYGLASGSHAIMVTAADNVGNYGFAIGSFSVDNTAPQIMNIKPAGYINTSSATVQAYIFDAVSGVDAASLDMYVEGGAVSGCTITGTDASCNVYGLAEGAHHILVSASDLAGNSASAAGYLSVDTGLPTITNLKPTGTVNKTSATISAYLADSGSGINAASIAVYLDGSPTAVSGCTWAASSASCNVYGLSETAHSYMVKVADNAGSTVSASGSFTVDTRLTTKYLRLSATGGDCSQIGTWNISTKTCTLTSSYSFVSSNGIIIDGDGITLDGGGYTLTGAGGYTSGIYVTYRSNSTIRNIKIRQFNYGVNLISANNAVVTGNTFTANTYGVYLSASNGTKVYGNNFNTNTNQAYVTGGTGNVFNLALPTGGNWWSNFSCTDADADGFCDAAYVFTGGQDNLPRVAQQ